MNQGEQNNSTDRALPGPLLQKGVTMVSSARQKLSKDLNLE